MSDVQAKVCSFSAPWVAQTFWNCSAKLSRTDTPGNAQGQRSADTESDVNFAELRLLDNAAEVLLKYLNFALAYERS